MLDEMINLLYCHPQVYVDVAVMDWVLPREEFHTYLKRIVQAGFGRRVMFGFDEMIWPQAIPMAIEAVKSDGVPERRAKARHLARQPGAILARRGVIGIAQVHHSRHSLPRHHNSPPPW